MANEQNQNEESSEEMEIKKATVDEILEKEIEIVAGKEYKLILETDDFNFSL